MAKRSREATTTAKSQKDQRDLDREHGPRKILAHFGLDAFVQALRTSKRVVVITGAGISVSCGIPDFRSENGVYRLVQQLDLGLGSPEELFDLEFFQHDPQPFFKFAKALYPGEYRPSPTHRFLRLLQDRGVLLRAYTQNIDGLEEQVGLTRYVACHGSFCTATCLSCKAKCTAQDIRPQVMQRQVPRCGCGGVIKPDITFFGEKLSGAVNRAIEADRRKADLLVVMGTSLKVAPVSKILSYMPPHVPQVLINREAVKPPREVSEGFDLNLVGDCDVAVRHLCAALGWELELGLAAGGGGGGGGGGGAGVAGGGGRGRAKAKGKEKGKVKGSPWTSTGGNAKLPPPPPPVFVPPNSYVLPGGEGGGGGGLGLLNRGEGDRDSDGGSHEDSYVEVVTCDGCNQAVAEVAAVWSCRECFDYDLCAPCYSRGRCAHATDLGHGFRRSDRTYLLTTVDPAAIRAET